MIVKRIVLAFAVFALMQPAIELNAQNAVTPEDKALAAETLYKLVERYGALGTLKSFDKASTNRDVANKYVALFTAEAEVINEIKPTEMGKTLNKPGITSIESYADENLEVFTDGLQVTINNVVIDYSNIAAKTATITIDKTTSGKALNATGVGTSIYKSRARLLLTVSFVNGYTLAKITKISLVSGNIECVDCQESEREHEVIYKTPFEFGMTLAVDAPLSSATGNTPDYAKFNYDDLISNNTSYEGYKNKIGYGAGVNLSFDFMFTKQRNVGFAVALGYSHQMATVTLDKLHLEYMGHNISPRTDNSFYYSDFLRYNTASGIKEKVSTDNLGASFLFKYQSDVAKKVGFFIQFGPSYYFFNQSTSKYSATVDHEAVYQPKINQQPLDKSGVVQREDWVITRSQVTRHLKGTQTAAEIFGKYNSTKGADVYLDKPVNGSVKNKFKLAIGGVLAAGAAISISERLQFLIGANVNVIYYSGSDIFNAKLDDHKDYNSLLNAVDKTLRINYGITLGLKFRLVTLN